MIGVVQTGQRIEPVGPWTIFRRPRSRGLRPYQHAMKQKCYSQSRISDGQRKTDKPGWRVSPDGLSGAIKESEAEAVLLFAVISHLNVNGKNFLTTIDKDSVVPRYLSVFKVIRSLSCRPI